MPDEIIYQERVASKRTTVLFATLMSIFLALSVWRHAVAVGGVLAFIFACLFLLFLFYTLNYRTLVIRITRQVAFSTVRPGEAIETIHRAKTEHPWGD